MSHTWFQIFSKRHPVLRDVFMWSIPALCFGLFLRAIFLSYHPYAYWGSDSRSYFRFAHMLLSDGAISLDEKRRYLYPLLMVPVGALPGAPLKWLAFLQHAIGLLGVLPMAYVVRHSLRLWKWWIIPATCVYAGMPIFLWYEHELLGETLFFSAFLWAFAGWIAWRSQSNPMRARRLFWWFFVALAAFLLTKPSGRFAVPGIIVGLITAKAWRVLTRRHWIALVALALATLSAGSGKQAAWLLYVASFPLTQLDSPKHAEYKAEVRAYAEPFTRELDAYYKRDDWPFQFLESPSEKNAPPLWAKLDKDLPKKRALYMDLALEGITARPLSFLYLGAQRIVASVNPSEFRLKRFESRYYPEKFATQYNETAEKIRDQIDVSLPMAFGLDPQKPLPPLDEFQQRLSPAPNCWSERTLLWWLNGFHRFSDIVHLPAPPPDSPASQYAITKAKISPLGWWLIFSLLASMLYWRSLGVWVIVAASYLAGVFLVSQVNPRYFAPAWLIFIPTLFIPLDLVFSAMRKKIR